MSGASDWLTKAREDLVTVELLQKFDTYPHLVAAFHCQQAVEKSLKAFLTAHGTRFAHRHDLGYLLELCRDVDAACAVLETDIAGLTSYAVEMRYPADLPLTISSEEVQRFYSQARRVFEFVSRALGVDAGAQDSP